MAVDLADLVDSLKREVNPPGESIFPNAVDSEYEGHLADGFWELVVAGYISGFVEADLIVTEDTATPTTDLTRQLQQLIIIAAGMRIIRMKFLQQDTLFRAVAGSVEFETRKSAQALDSLLKNLQTRFDDIVSTLPNSNVPGSVFYSDIITLRSAGRSTFAGY